MRFIISKSHLVNGLNIVTKGVSHNTPIPVLTGVKFELKEDGLILIGSDTDISIKTFIPFKENKKEVITVFDEGECVFQAKYITDIAKKMEGERIEFVLIDGNLVKISDQKTNVNLNGISVEEYPFIDFALNSEVIKIKGDVLKRVIQQTIFATSQKETRPILTGVNFKIDGNTLEATSTDTYRLARKKIVIGDSAYFNVTIPSKSLTEISKIIEGNEEVHISFYEKKVIFILNNTIISSRVISGTYPETDRLVPKEFEIKLETIAGDIISSIERASLLTTDRNNIVRLHMSPDKIEISSRSQEVGSVVERIEEFKYEGSKLEISFSAGYVLDAIKAIGSEDIEILFNGEMKPFIIKGKKDDSLTQLILPVRTYQ